MLRTASSSLALTALFLIAPSAAQAAEESPSVVLLSPSSASCVDTERLAADLVETGPYFLSVAPAAASAAPPRAPLFKITGAPASLRLRGWGLTAESLGGQAALGTPDSVADLDTTLPPQTCESATEAAGRAIGKALGSAPPAPSRVAAADSEGQLQELLRESQKELGGDPRLQVAVAGEPLGLTFVVQDAQGRCARRTWLTLEPGQEPKMGASVSELRDQALACLAMPPEPGASAAVAGPAADAAGAIEGSFRLPRHTGALLAGLGVVVSAGAVAATPYSPSALVLGAVPALAGGIGSYVVGERYRQTALLGGYWLGLAGTGTAVAANDGTAKTWLISGALSAGSLTSAAMAAYNDARRGDEGALPAWAVALPSTIGAGVSMAALFAGDRGPSSLSLAAVGGVAAVLPSVWLLVGLDEQSPDRAPRLGVIADGHTTGLTIGGSF